MVHYFFIFQLGSLVRDKELDSRGTGNGGVRHRKSVVEVFHKLKNGSQRNRRKTVCRV